MAKAKVYNHPAIYNQDRLERENKRQLEEVVGAIDRDISLLFSVVVDIRANWCACPTQTIDNLEFLQERLRTHASILLALL